MDYKVLIGAGARFRQLPGVIVAETGDEMVMLDPNSGAFLDLSKTAARIWSLLDEPMTVPALCQRMAEHFDIDAATCRDDVEAFVLSLAERGLIETV